MLPCCGRDTCVTASREDTRGGNASGAGGLGKTLVEGSMPPFRLVVIFFERFSSRRNKRETCRRTRSALDDILRIYYYLVPFDPILTPERGARAASASGSGSTAPDTGQAGGFR